MLATIMATASLCHSAGYEVSLATNASEIALSIGAQTWHFTRSAGIWAFDRVEVGGKPVVTSISRSNSFFESGGEASRFEVLTNGSTLKSVRFLLSSHAVTYTVDGASPLPQMRIRIEGPPAATCAFRAASADPREHGAWVTHGYVATDADDHEDFIDSSNPLVFGHSWAGGLDACYLFVPTVNGHIQKNGRTEQRSDTWFQSGRLAIDGGQFAGYWHLRLGANEPKEFGVVFDRDLGGRLSDVCEKYFAVAVDSLVDITSIPQHYDPEKCLQVMPVRLAAPDAFIPGYGLMMDEFPHASYPFAHDSVWQTPALLAFEGLASGRDWERNFARYFLEKTPLEGKDGSSYFVRRPGGLTRWAYWSTYKEPFPHFEGGTWWQADMLYRTALALEDSTLRRAALEMVLHDLNVKLDLDKMCYPPCWDAIQNRVGDDHRDDWFKTPGLAYCAYVASKIAFTETRDPVYLAKADRIGDWFAGFIAPESKLNFLQGNNMHAVFSHYLTLAFLDRYERSRDRQFFDLARDMAWVQMMTTCVTAAKDSAGRPLTGTTCVGVRGCVDYDCAPNLCHEKDLSFVHMIGPLLEHVQGPAYAKYLALNRLVLDKDSWKSAWATELRDTNLRTMYDSYARGMANLIYALDTSNDPWVVPVELLVSKSDTNIVCRRELVLANGSSQDRQTLFKARFLKSGQYNLLVNGADLGPKTDRDLANGIPVSVPATTMKRVEIRALALDSSPPVGPAPTYDASVTHLSELQPYAAQRGTGSPQPTYRQNQSLDGNPIRLGGESFPKGLGCGANTVLLYELKGNYARFQAKVGVDQEMAAATNPPPSVFFTVHVDGRLRFESGPMFKETAARPVDIDIRNAQMLMLRVSCNWDDHGNNVHDHGDWADARLTGKTTTQDANP